MKHCSALLLLSLAPLTLSHAWAGGTNPAPQNNPGSSKLISSTIAPIPLSRKAPKYPMAMGRIGSEGWVQVSFVIGKDGSVIDPIVEDSSGSRSFEKAALRAMSQWQYSPAMVDGEAIEQCQNKVQMDFKLHKASKGVRRKFRSTYIKAREAMDANDLSLSAEYIAKLRDDKQFNGMESAWFWMLEADFAREKKQPKAELKHIKRAINTDKDGKLLGKNNYLTMLQQRFVLEIQFAKYADALATFENIKNQDNSAKTVEHLQQYASQVEQLLSGDNPIVVAGKIGKGGNWWHTLSRSSFAFNNVQGEVDRLELRCNNKRETYTFADDSTWTIPKKWGQCSVLVVGDKDADFNLLELSPQA